MTQFILRRLLQMIPVLLLVTIGVYVLLLMMPGDPVDSLFAGEVAFDPALKERLMREMGYDQPVYVQYVKWLSRMVQGDWGKSIQTRQPVTQSLLDRLPVTLQLAGFAWLIGVSISIPAGIIAAVRRNSWLDVSATFMSIGGVAMPSFWMGLMLILLFAAVLRWLPASGFVSVFENPTEGLKYLLLPAVTLGTHMTATTMRQTRSALLEVMAQDYIVTARAKGLSERVVIGLHALKNSLLPVATVMGLQLSRLIGGTLIIEQIFAIPGMGRFAISAVFANDVPVVQGVVLMMALSVLIGNLVTDILYGYLDPRIRYS